METILEMNENVNEKSEGVEKEREEEEEEKQQEEKQQEEEESLSTCCNYHESVINYLKCSLDKSIPMNTFPVRCFTCDEILSHKWELYLLVRYYFVHQKKEEMEARLGYPVRDEEFERSMKLSIRNLQSFMDGSQDIFDNPSNKAFEQLKITKECCKRMFKSMAE